MYLKFGGVRAVMKTGNGRLKLTLTRKTYAGSESP